MVVNKMNSKNIFKIKRDNSILNQVFSKARNKISPKAFVELNYEINKVIYNVNNEYKPWNRYMVFEICGNFIEVANTEALITQY
jgi:hypothetical protein